MLASQTTPRWVAPALRLGGPRRARRSGCAARASAPATPSSAAGSGSRPPSTRSLQRAAEKWVRAAAIVPHARDPEAAAKNLGFDELQPWMENLRDKALRNGALVALDYQTGELVAYVGSASYYSSSTRPEFQPQFDVLGNGFRQPGSAFKPFNYAVGIDDRALTAATMLMDVGTDFGGDYTPSDADLLERGPVRVRNALQFSLNIPAVKAMAVNGPDHVFAKAQEFGMTFQVGPDRCRTGARPRRPGGPPGRPRDGLRDAGQRRPARRRTRRSWRSRTAQRRGRRRAVCAAGRDAGRQPAGRLHRDRHPGRQHRPGDQPVLGQVRARRPGAPPARDPQDRHEQRRQGPQRLRLHRAADRGGPGGRRVRARGRRLERQLGQQPGLDAGGPALLDRGLDLRLAGLPAGGQRRVAR